MKCRNLILNSGTYAQLFTPCGSNKLLKLLDGVSDKNDVIFDNVTNGSAGVFYVNKNYTGSPAAVVTSTAVQSANATYNTQLSKATMDDAVNAYPDPYSAQHAAQKAIDAGTINTALIIVGPGNIYTVGSDNPVNNGTAAGVAAGPETADLGFGSTDNTNTASLLKHKIHTVFLPGSGFTYINKTYPIHLGFTFNQATGQTLVSSIKGEGIFRQVYGEGQGFIATIVEISNQNATVDLRFKRVYLNQAFSFKINDFEKVTIDIDEMYATDTSVFIIKNYYQPDTGFLPSLNIRLKDVHWGYGQAGAGIQESSDNWYFTSMGNVRNPINVAIDIDNLNMRTRKGSGALFWCNANNAADYVTPDKIQQNGVTFNYHIKHLYERNNSLNTTNGHLTEIQGLGRLVSDPSNRGYSNNNYIKLHIENGDTENNIGNNFAFGFEGVNNHIIYQLDQFHRMGSDLTPNRTNFMNVADVTPIGGSNIFTLKGNIAVDNGSLLGVTGTYGTIIVDVVFQTKNLVNGTIINVANDTSKLIIKNAILISSGTTGNSISATVPREALSAGLVSNLTVNANVTVKGATPVIDASINGYV